MKNTEKKNTPPWLWVVAIICGIYACFVLFSGISDLLHII